MKNVFSLNGSAFASVAHTTHCALALVCALMLAALSTAIVPEKAHALPGEGTEEKSYSVEIVSYYGETQVDTAVIQSQQAFESSEWAIIVGAKGWSDALAASGLSGGLECPILYVYADELPLATQEELARLGVQKVLVLGGTA
ncbi:MAG: cell wall-binding repeat-containing protein, partial [Eggerthellaceae bacterium]|nr:cell wall-binding repeat-containing protein [Eggerthellaceae bacterium]